MAETKQIPTRTELRVDGNDIDIFTQYFVGEDSQDILSVFIAQQQSSQDGVSYKEGDGIVSLKEPNETIINVNSNGELIIVSPDANKYSIVDQDLIYTE